MANPSDPRRVETLFAAAVSLPPEERQAFLDQECGDDRDLRDEVASLLAAAHDAETGMELDAAAAAALLTAADIRSAGDEGRVLGPYRLLRELGRGGMGVVYLAERADGVYEQRVAFKLLPPSLRSEALERRFALERQILAQLEHPGIARLLDGGVAEHGQPYLVLEYIDGEPLTDWCDERRLGIRDRLEIFLRVCEAVQYAHGRLVVHRDLKPANILVTESGDVKLLDFGIAKLLTEEGVGDATMLTRLGLRPYTPGYAAPEQLRGEAITVATDVYSLGVLLYELLCGRLPRSLEASVEGGRDEWGSPTRPSVKVHSGESSADEAGTPSSEEIAARRGSHPEPLRRRLAGDLDIIALKALREEPAERYESVRALADDVRRHLGDQPIAARPASAFYRGRKFFRRHRLGVAATALVVLAVLGGLAGTTWQARIAERERDSARAEAAKAQQVTEFLAEVFRQANPLESKGEEMTVGEALDRGAERIELDLADQPIVQADLMRVLGGTYLELGNYGRASELFTRELDLRRRYQEADHPEVGAVLGNLSALRFQQGDYEGALQATRRAIGIVEGAKSPETEKLVNLWNNLGIISERTGDYPSAIQAYERALAILAAYDDPDREGVAMISNNLGFLQLQMDEFEKASETLQKALEIYEATLGPDHPDVANCLVNLSIVRLQLEDYDGLEEDLDRMLAIYRKAYGPVHERVGGGLKQLGEFYAATGRHDEAIEAYQQAVDVNRQALGENHPNVAYPLHDLGELFFERGRADEALPHVREAVKIRASLEPDNPRLATSLTLLGRIEAALGRFDRAERTLRRALASRRAASDPSGSRIASVATDLAGVLVERDQCGEAIELLDEAVAIQRAAGTPDGERLAEVEALLARCPAPSDPGSATVAP